MKIWGLRKAKLDLITATPFSNFRRQATLHGCRCFERVYQVAAIHPIPLIGIHTTLYTRDAHGGSHCLHSIATMVMTRLSSSRWLAVRGERRYLYTRERSRQTAVATTMGFSPEWTPVWGGGRGGGLRR
jgi:hypothetical protein